MEYREKITLLRESFLALRTSLLGLPVSHSPLASERFEGSFTDLFNPFNSSGSKA